MNFTYLLEAPEWYDRSVRYSWRWAIIGLIAGGVFLWLQFGTEFGKHQSRDRAGAVGVVFAVAGSYLLLNRSPRFKLAAAGIWTPQSGFWPRAQIDIRIEKHGKMEEAYMVLYSVDQQKCLEKIRLTLLDISREELEVWLTRMNASRTE